MQALPIIEDLDVIKDRGPCLCAGAELGLMDALRLERGEEALHGRVIQAVAPPAHRRLDPVPLQHRLIRARGVLPEFKWSSQHLERGGCDGHGHSEAAFGSVRARRVALAWS